MAREVRNYPEEVKQHARARWLAGDSLSEIVAQLEVPKATVQGWVRGYKRGVDAAIQSIQLGREVIPKNKAAEAYEHVNLDQQVARTLNGYFDAVGAINRLIATGDASDWLKGQSAGELALLTGVLSDKLLRVAASLRIVRREPDES